MIRLLAAGTVKRKRDPRPTCDSTQIRPPKRSTIFLQVANPIPLPGDRKNPFAGLLLRGYMNAGSVVSPELKGVSDQILEQPVELGLIAAARARTVSVPGISATASRYGSR